MVPAINTDFENKGSLYSEKSSSRICGTLQVPTCYSSNHLGKVDLTILFVGFTIHPTHFPSLLIQGAGFTAVRAKWDQHASKFLFVCSFVFAGLSIRKWASLSLVL